MKPSSLTALIAVLLPLGALAQVAADFPVAAFGAVGDGIHDDGPAIRKAFAAAGADGIPSTVVFEKKKTYRLGNNPQAWHYFQMKGHEDLVIEGNGATLLCSDSNLTFHFDGGRDITVRGLAFDMVRPAFTQGEVVAASAEGTLDLRIMDGYPEPPDEAFLVANKHNAHGGGGRHLMVFEQGGKSRNPRMRSDHLYVRNITRVSPGIFRFHIKEDYVPRMTGIAVGNWVSYGFNGAGLSASAVALRNKSASTYAQIAVDRVENITFEKLDFFGSMNGGIRVSDMLGDVTLRQVRVVRKPGTRHLLSTISDALHLMNIRGKLVVENCEIEAPGDDCLNVGTLMERIVEVSKDDPKVMTLRTTDNHRYHYTIREGDKLQMVDTKAKREVGVVTVTRAEFDPRSRIHRVVLDRELPGLDPAVVLALNLDQMTSSTVIRNNVMRPFMRNAMLVRAQNMIIDGNQLVGDHGGVLGLNFNYSMGESARLRNLRITRNTISGFQGSAIIAANIYHDRQGVLDARSLVLTDNLFHAGPAPTIRISGFKGLEMRGNRFVKDGQTVADHSSFVAISNCTDVLLAP